MADLENIELVLARLQNNYSELARTFYTLFYDPNPQDITLEWYDENNILQTLTIPNRAKDQKYIKSGQTDPEGFVEAPPATIYQNLRTGELFVKNSGTGTSGWTKIINEAEFETFLIRGEGEPNLNITAQLGTLYIDILTGILYVKSLPTGNEGWQPLIDVTDSRFIHFIDLKKNVKVSVDFPS